MDFTFEQGSESEVMPILVKLYDSQQLTNLAANKDPKARTELTSIITNLLEMDLSPRESELVADVLISLIRQVERDLSLAVAERLSILDTVPLRLVLHLANEDIDVARPVLQNSKILNDIDLIYIIKSKTADYWRAIAKRKQLSDQIIDVLADTEDLETAINLVENKNITLTDYAISYLVDLAANNDSIAEPLVSRDEVTQEIAEKLYKSVSIALKEHIASEFDIVENDVTDAVNEVALEFIQAVDSNISETRYVETKPNDAHIRAAKRYKDKDLLTLPLMMKTLKRGQYQSFIAQFAQHIGLATTITNEIMLQKSGQGLAVACKAKDIQKNDYISIYLLISRLRNKGGMVDAKDLKNASGYYDTIDRATAEGILKSSSGDIVKM